MKKKMCKTPEFVDNRYLTDGNPHIEEMTDMLFPAMSQAGLTREETKDFAHCIASKMVIALLEQQIRETNK